MTPEERFERIEKTLDRMTNQSELYKLTSEMRMTRIERTQEQIADELKEVADELKELVVIAKRNETNLEILQNFMSESAHRQEAQVDRISNSLQNLIHLFERHVKDGHGPNGRRKRK